MEINNAEIWKFPLSGGAEQTLKIPSVSQLLQMRAINDKLYIWAMVDPTSEPIEIGIRVYATGEEIVSEDLPHMSYLGTAIVQGGKRVWHAFFDTRTRFRVGLEPGDLDG